MARILVVDDAPQNLDLIELYLQGTEFEVVPARRGTEAIELSRQQAFELILLDVVMPGIDGFEVCRRLKNDPRTAFVPVIFLTGRMGDESEKLAAYQLGAVDYIQKPVDREELVARIRVMLRLEDARSRLDRENAALRAQLGKVEQRLEDTCDSLRDLERLSVERAAQGAPEVLTLDADLRITAIAPGVLSLLPGLRVGKRIVECGASAARVASILERGEQSADLVVPADDGSERELLVTVRRVDAGEVFVMLQDVTGVRDAERRVADRELTEPAAKSRTSGYRMTDFVGSSFAVLDMTERVARLRQSRSTVLIYGESGTGKELVARALHFDGRHRSAPFIPLHCGAIAQELIESELFGHEKGAFTGAQHAREGLFEAADGGTIFLDEIAEMSPSVQVKLLRVLQRGEIRPVGANQPRIVDVRIIAATNRDLLELVCEGKFREDLYYRLDVVSLPLPPLRERLGDMREIAEHFLQVANRRHDRLDRPVLGFSRGALDRMQAYSWPGNVRELEHVIERAFALGVGEVLQESDLPPRVRRGSSGLRPSPVQRGRDVVLTPQPPPDGDLGLRERRDAADRQAILDALRNTGGDKMLAAQRLGMARSTFYRRLKELGI